MMVELSLPPSRYLVGSSPLYRSFPARGPPTIAANSLPHGYASTSAVTAIHWRSEEPTFRDFL